MERKIYSQTYDLFSEPQFYRDMYGKQYKFRVIGIRKDVAE
jgi:hypothetical protein